MSTDIKKNDKRDYAEKVMGMTDARFISEAESFRFEKRRTPVSTWIAAACFALIFAAAAILLIKPMGERPIETTHPTEEPTEEITAPISEEHARDIIASLIIYHKGQFTRSAQLGNLKLSPSVAADLEKRQLCIDETEARLGKNFSKASVTGTTTFRSFTPNGKNLTVSFTELTKLVTGYAASDLILITAEHTAEIAPDGTILSDFFSEDAIGFTNIPIEPAPSQAPIPYNREEYDTLLAFFELKDENGVKNGEKCFKDYDPTRIDFWGTEREDSNDSWLLWDENGYLTQIVLRGTEDEPIMLAGEFKVHGFEMLENISVNEYVTFESSGISECGKLDHVYIRTKADATIAGDYFDFFKVTSEGKCHFESSGRRADLDEPEIGYAFNVNLTAEGSGSVEVSGWLDEHYYYARVCAVPTEGHKFLGWYDAEGNLISEKAIIQIAFDHESDDEIAYIFDRYFTGTAKFAPELVADPWYLEKAWEYAEFANREYGFGFTKENPEFSAWDKRISFTHYESEDSEGQHISICFKRDAKEVSYVEIYGDRSDRPEEYASMSDEELRALYDTLSLISTYTVTREDMLQAGYTLDGTDEDYVKIAEYCGKLKAAELMNCNELHYNHCIKADVGNAQRNTEPSVKDSTDPVYCWVTYYFRPSYPKLFTLYHMDIGCSMIPLDDAEHPGWIDFWGDVLISETADGWSCELAYISGY